jgi:hypothetical protein
VLLFRNKKHDAGSGCHDQGLCVSKQARLVLLLLVGVELTDALLQNEILFYFFVVCDDARTPQGVGICTNASPGAVSYRIILILPI